MYKRRYFKVRGSVSVAATWKDTIWTLAGDRRVDDLWLMDKPEQTEVLDIY